MKNFKILTFLMAILMSVNVVAAENQPLQNHENEVTFVKQQVQNQAPVVTEKQSPKETQKAGIGLYVLALFIPFVAVGIYTSWKMPTVWNLIWSFFGFFPGVIHAFLVLSRK